MRGDNVFIYQNIIIHYKYLHNNIRTFVEFLDQSIYAFFCPAPPRGFLSSPRPAGKSSAPHIPAVDIRIYIFNLQVPSFRLSSSRAGEQGEGEGGKDDHDEGHRGSKLAIGPGCTLFNSGTSLRECPGGRDAPPGGRDATPGGRDHS